MDHRDEELHSSPGEGALRGGARQARLALRLVSRDRTVRRLMALEVLAMIGLWMISLLFRGNSGGDRAAGFFGHWVFWVASVGIVGAFSVAIACAVDERIDGAPGDLRSVGAAVRERTPAILWWWLLWMAAVVGLGLGAGALLGPVLALLLVAGAWEVLSFFVVPVIVLQNCGPPGTAAEALRLLRRRWGRVLAGLVVIGFLFVLAYIAFVYVSRAATGGHPATASDPLLRYGAPVLCFYAVYALLAAARAGFAVILARDAVGDLPGRPPVVAPRPRLRIGLRRVVTGASILAIALLVFGALFVVHRSGTGPLTPRRAVMASQNSVQTRPALTEFATPIRETAARWLRPGAPVVLAGRRIGRVSMVHLERLPLVEVFFLVDPKREPTVIHAEKRAAIRDGRAYLLIVPR